MSTTDALLPPTDALLPPTAAAIRPVRLQQQSGRPWGPMHPRS
ncbi:hypothetical protein AB0H86_12100 [Streptomyces sp. NPDC050997]